MNLLHLKNKIFNTQGWMLPGDDYDESDQRQLNSLIDSLPVYLNDTLNMPLVANHHFDDPRVVSKVYRTIYYKLKPAIDLDSYKIPLLKLKKLKIVLDLDWTIVYLINPKVAQTVHSIKSEIKRLEIKYKLKFSLIYFSAMKLYFILAIRPNLDSFLRALNQKANLYLSTSLNKSYLHDILKAIDPNGNYFGQRILITGDGEKSLKRYKLNPEETLIIDSRWDTWSLEDQNNVIPSLRFLPCPEDHNEFETSSRYEEKVKTFSFVKDSRWSDDTDLFLDSQGTQFSPLKTYVWKIHKERFVSINREAVAQINQKFRKRVLKNKKLFLADSLVKLVSESKIQSIRFMIESAGGEVTENIQEADYTIDDNLDYPTAKPLRWLVSKYFLL